jgi:hypothetical protein
MSIYLFKDGDRMGMVAEVAGSVDLQIEFIQLLSRMADEGSFQGDWEFQLEQWIPQWFCIMNELVYQLEPGKHTTHSRGDLSGEKVAQLVSSRYDQSQPIIEVPTSPFIAERENEIERYKTKIKELNKLLGERNKQVILLQEQLARQNER